MKGKIIKGIAGFYYVHDGHSKVYECKAKGIFRNRNIKPLVGDDVEFEVLDPEECTGNIIQILPRSSRLIRPAAANVDQAVIVFATKEPIPNFSLLDRFLIIMEQQGCPVRILFGKSDQADEAECDHLRRIYRDSGSSVSFVSTYTGEGLDAVRNMLRGKTSILAGPSGVGKSSLLNSLVKDAHMETGTLSRKIARGKQTTRHSEIFFVEDDTFLIDTPGFSSLWVEGIEAEDCREYFREFEPYWNQCRFPDCRHINEPDCRIREAVAEGAISKERYESYCQLYAELKDKRKY